MNPLPSLALGPFSLSLELSLYCVSEACATKSPASLASADVWGEFWEEEVVITVNHTDCPHSPRDLQAGQSKPVLA